MKKFNKVIAVLAAAVMALSIPMSSYAAFGFAKTEQTAQTEDTYTFASGATVIKMGAPADDIIKALGNPTKPVFEMDSCAYQGKEKVYTYPGFELGVGPSADGKTQVVTSIFVLDGSAATPEGIKFGSSVQDVVKAYGNAASVSFGAHHYIKSNTEMIIYETASKVDGIEYIFKMK